jgi:beta-galactosidase
MQGQPLGGIAASAFKNTILRIDSSRPITANSEDTAGDTLTRITDIESFSYNYGEYDTAHRKYPWKPIMGGESASCVSDRAYYGNTNATTGHVTADDVGCVIAAWQSVATRPWVIGNFAWTGTDYKGEPSPLNWPDINSHFGVVDIAGFEKDSAGYYKAWWRNDSSKIYTLPATWNFAPGTTLKEVAVFAAAAAAELFVDGASLGVRNISAFGAATWQGVVVGPGGALAAKSYDASGAVLATTALAKTGAAAALRVTCDAGSAAIAADGADVALVRVEVVDAAGNVVPDASPALVFTASAGGEIIGVANGDPADPTPDKVGDPALPYGGVWARAAFNGLARAIVRSTMTPSAVTVNVTAPGLAAGSVVITTA